MKESEEGEQQFLHPFSNSIAILGTTGGDQDGDKVAQASPTTKSHFSAFPPSLILHSKQPKSPSQPKIAIQH